MAAIPEPIIVVGLNAALQKRFILPKDAVLVPGNVHRATEIQTGVGGKGQDVAISLSCLDCKNVLLAQFVGSGCEGDTVQTLLLKVVGEAATTLSVRTRSQMRTCTTIVASDESTELVEPSGVVTEGEKIQLLQKLQAHGRNPTAICFMGSMPAGLPDDTYGKIYESVASSKTLCVIDSVTGLGPLLSAIANKSDRGPALLKLNASELCRLAGVAKSSSETAGITLSELREAVGRFVNNYKSALHALAGLALTDGKHPAHLVCFNQQSMSYEIVQTKVPALDPRSILYPIGAGDSVSAGTLASWISLQSIGCLGGKLRTALSERFLAAHDNGMSAMAGQLETSFSFGLACGSASCLSEENSVFSVEKVLCLFKELPPPALLSKHELA
jgi:tagatose 6-phosphate kinase